MCACVRISIVSVLALLDNLVPRLVSPAFYCKLLGCSLLRLNITVEEKLAGQKQ